VTSVGFADRLIPPFPPKDSFVVGLDLVYFNLFIYGKPLKRSVIPLPDFLEFISVSFGNIGNGLICDG
jgi:hypothetical protein